MIKTFIFDLGKVIVPFELDNALKILESVCDFSSLDVKEKIFASQEVLLFEKGEISPEAFFDFLKNLLNLRMNFDEFASAWNSIFSFEPIISESLIERLEAKYRLIVLSDTNKLHFEFIKQKFPILRHFSDFVVSYEVGFLKPSPEIFQVAVEKAECLPKECFFTDDREANVEGAKKLGINALQFISPDQFEQELKKLNLLETGF
jgi:putative hydrolase of the HAD superfamily